MITQTKYVVGVDFGATHIKAGVVADNGMPISFVIKPSLSYESINSVISRIAEAIEEAIEASELAFDQIIGVSVGACGLVDRNNGLLLSSSVLPTWHSVPISRLLHEKVKLHILLDNDANSAVYGEWWGGIGKGTTNLVGMTLGTGIGGGIILDKNIFYGSHDNAGEFGHMTIIPDGPECYCGNRGCLGSIASAQGIVSRYVFQREKQLSAPSNQNENITSKTIYEFAISGDQLAKEVIVQTGKYLGIGAANLLNCFNPDMVVFTGGVTKMGSMLLNIIRDEAQSRVYANIYSLSRIEFGLLIDKAGVVGSAGIYFRWLDRLTG